MQGGDRRLRLGQRLVCDQRIGSEARRSGRITVVQRDLAELRCCHAGGVMVADRGGQGDSLLEPLPGDRIPLIEGGARPQHQDVRVPPRIPGCAVQLDGLLLMGGGAGEVAEGPLRDAQRSERVSRRS